MEESFGFDEMVLDEVVLDEPHAPRHDVPRLISPIAECSSDDAQPRSLSPSPPHPPQPTSRDDSFAPPPSPRKPPPSFHFSPPPSYSNTKPLAPSPLKQLVNSVQPAFCPAVASSSSSLHTITPASRSRAPRLGMRPRTSQKRYTSATPSVAPTTSSFAHHATFRVPFKSPSLTSALSRSSSSSSSSVITDEPVTPIVAPPPPFAEISSEGQRCSPAQTKATLPSSEGDVASETSFDSMDLELAGLDGPEADKFWALVDGSG